MLKTSLFLVLQIAALAPNLVLAQEVVGVVGAANSAPTGRAPGKAQRTLKAGSEIYFKDRIVTKRGGSAQLAFLDRSTLNVSENSDLVIDEFVYKPGTRGAMTAHLARGVMRFVGGDISHEGTATIETPVVTIGIRGGIGTIGYVKDAKDLSVIPGVPPNFRGGAIIVNGYGTMTVRNGASETIISRPGFAVFVGGANEAIAAPVRFDMASAKAMMSALSSRPNQRGGLSQKAAATAPRNISVARLSLRVATPRAVGINALDFTSIFHVGNALARNQSQAQQAVHLQTQISTQAVNGMSAYSAIPVYSAPSAQHTTQTTAMDTAPAAIHSLMQSPNTTTSKTTPSATTPPAATTPTSTSMPTPAPAPSTPAAPPIIVIPTPIGPVIVWGGPRGPIIGPGHGGFR